MFTLDPKLEADSILAAMVVKLKLPDRDGRYFWPLLSSGLILLNGMT